MDNFPVLETERLLLREFRESDAQAVFDIFSLDEVTWYLDSVTMQELSAVITAPSSSSTQV